jgi:outer membrane biosynthesis protein TonB
MIILASAPLAADQQKLIAHCCAPDARKLSAKQVKSLLDKSKPSCAHMLHIKGKLVLKISVDFDGVVTCAALVSGHPLIGGPAIDSIKSWKFRPYIERGLRQSFCGTVTLRYDANKYAVKYAVVQDR